jgi:hypothetical protein
LTGLAHALTTYLDDLRSANGRPLTLDNGTISTVAQVRSRLAHDHLRLGGPLIA